MSTRTRTRSVLWLGPELSPDAKLVLEHGFDGPTAYVPKVRSALGWCDARLWRAIGELVTARVLAVEQNRYGTRLRIVEEWA